MAENFIQPPANTGIGLKVRTFEVNAVSGPALGTPVEQQGVILCDPTVAANQASVSTPGELLTSSGGKTTFPIVQANIQGGATVMKASAGRLCRILITTTTGGADLTITDGVAGTIIALIVSGTTKGTIIILDMPAATSINLPQNAAWTGAATASFV